MAGYVNPLPYVIVFAILVIALLVVLAWFLSLLNKNKECSYSPKMMCSNEWRCETNCPTGSNHNVCFENGTRNVGLAECLIGLGSTTNDYCQSRPGVSIHDPFCDCIVDSGLNCMSGCPRKFGDMTTPICCCVPGSAGCPATNECPWMTGNP